MSKYEDLRAGLETAFINGTAVSNSYYRPQFVSNNHKEGKKVLSTIKSELLNCDKFQISVAFITEEGLKDLLMILKELERKSIRGEILTTNYLSFSEPRALDKLHGLSNITLKMYDVEKSGAGFHTKGYIFQKGEIYKIIIGSSNLTGSALTSNKEWNTKLVSTEGGEMTQNIISEFNSLWNSRYSLAYEDFIDEYREKYRIIELQKKIAKQDEIPSAKKYDLKPNSMQAGFVSNLREILDAGKNRALLISATGTGKTYASAFAVRDLGFKKVLFIAHRMMLLNQAIDAYKMVFSDKTTMGKIGGGYSDFDSDIIFAMVETLHKEENLFRFSPNEFDCIVLDEAHHSPANTYQKVMDYFKPRLFLGMTATPDKRDDNIEGRNVYKLFDYQIAYEIRLQKAMEENLLCPFHYYGISDIMLLNDEQVKSDKLSEEDFNKLTSDERVRHIIEQAEYYGFSGDRVKGLIFCNRKKECIELSNKFNKLGYRTTYLFGDHSEEQRKKAFERLAMNEEAASAEMEPLDYIFSVDILNEGVDIIEVNQVIMLRATDSPIVYIQQLGRGLRKAPGKESVVVLDFIGNYKNNFMIPIALSGDRTYNKDNYRRFVLEGERMIPGQSSIEFDEISKERIFSSIDNANFSDIKLIKENYFNLKYKLGRIPKLSDFDAYGEMDVVRIFDNNNLGSYYKFLVKYEKDYKIRLSDDEEQVIEFISKKIANGKRIQELQLLKRILTYRNEISKIGLFSGLASELQSYGKSISDNQVKNLVNVLTNQFPQKKYRDTYEKCVFIEKGGIDYIVSKPFSEMLDHNDFYNVLEELVDFGISRYERDYSNSYKNTDLVLYQKYTYEDVCRLLNWSENQNAQSIGGYKYDKKTKTFPVFINYEKGENISDTIKYADHFVPGYRDRLISISKSKRKITSKDVQNLLNSKDKGIQVELFVRKNKDDKRSKEFYYLGHMTATKNYKQFTMPNTNVTAVEIEWILEEPVREDIYEYIVGA